jgi:hypothetical protein
MCTVLLPPGDNPFTVNKYIICEGGSNTQNVSIRPFNDVCRYSFKCYFVGGIIVIFYNVRKVLVGIAANGYGLD